MSNSKNTKSALRATLQKEDASVAERLPDVMAAACGAA